MSFNLSLHDTSTNGVCSIIDILNENPDYLTGQTELQLIDIISCVFQVYSIKKKPYFDKGMDIINTVIDTVNPWATPHISNILSGFIQTSVRYQKEYAYVAFKRLIEKNPTQISECMPHLIPLISHDINDISENVKTNSREVLGLLLKCSGNNDLDMFIPDVLNGLKNLDAVQHTIESLASCVFVQNVKAPALAIAAPVLFRGLKFKTEEIKRKSCIIIENMCKLVEHPKEILPFYSELHKLLEICSETISNPNAREVCNRALNVLKNVCSEHLDEKFSKTYDDFINFITEQLKNDSIEFKEEDVLYCSILVTNMCNAESFEKEEWVNLFNKYLPIVDEVIVNNVLEYAKLTFVIKEEIFEDNEEGENIYQGKFSLAYGSMTLLTDAYLHLKRNRFYGLLGPNNCGKTTLMRAIGNEKVEGFPKKDELRTIFVEHEIAEVEVGEDDKGFPILNIDLCGIDWVVHCCNEIYKMEPKVTRDQVKNVMAEIGFGNSEDGIGKDRAADMNMLVTTYSGGWKMKMQLCAASLMNADILMLDEPTGHLDTTNIAWLKNWLKDFMNGGGSLIVTSHDSQFLNDMCTHIIDFQNRKLRMFAGTKGKVLEEFVEKFPEKKGYFELKNDVIKFVFPEPGPLEGVKSMSKYLLKMENVTYTYPTRDIPTIFNVSLDCSRISRVGVIGANGAGKTTMIKILIGEIKTTSGKVTKHPDMRIAYVAQHAFHHLEKHITKTPTQYIMWRFAGNEDKEAVDMINKEPVEKKPVKKYYISTETMELKACNLPIEEKKAVELESIVSRRTNKKDKCKEYEVRWKNCPPENTMWVNREILLNMGHIQMVQRHDEKEAVIAGLMSKTLTTKDIEKHFANFGIDAEQANHTPIGSLSGGQKVKVVLAASLWQHPHLVILDEPTNYLDRDGLGALTNAIHEFQGGVVIISHNKEFTSAVAQEKWIMEKGLLRKEGESIDNSVKEENKLVFAEDKIIKDSMGNEIKVEDKGNMTKKEIKKEIKSLQSKLRVGKKKGTLSEDEIFEIEDKLEELQALENK